MRNLSPIILLFFSLSLFAQEPVNIALILDRLPGNQLENNFTAGIKEEILQLLQHRYTLNFNEYFIGTREDEVPGLFENAYRENDFIIGIGTISSFYTIGLAVYPKPTMASIVLDAQLQGLAKTATGSSGIPNFTFLESPFNIERDLDVLYEIYPFDHLLVVSDERSVGAASFIEQLFTNYLKAKTVEISSVNYGADMSNVLKELGAQKTAAFAFPYLSGGKETITQFFDQINAQKIPSAALFGEEYLEAGALLAYQSSQNLQKIPRRIALSVMKILEGQKAEDLSVEMQTFGENLMLNMKTARQIDVYPDFDMISRATTVLNLEKIQTDRNLTLHEAIGEALKNNLDIQIEQADVEISGTEVDIAFADLLPQLDLTTSIAAQDNLSTLSYQGALGRTNWLISGELSQVIFSEPLLANIAIQKMLKQTEERELYQKQLDVVLDVTNAFTNILFAKSNLNIQQENVARNNENFDISKAKEAIGYGGASDLNRWEAELANAYIELNSAYAGLRQAKFLLNQLLNRPINEPFEISDISLDSSRLLISESRMGFINNYGQLDKFGNFIVQYAKENLPELDQIDIGLEVQQRLQLSRERAMYLPTVGINASANRVLAKIDVPEAFMKKDNETSWNIGLGISYPIFQGNNRKRLIQQSKLNILQLRKTRKNLENKLEFGIRANLENLAVSFSRMELSQTAAEASRKNFEIVQNAYTAGQTNITTLIDAQNNSLLTELTATNAVYTFILDFLTLERSIGYYNFLATPAQRDEFFQLANQYLQGF